MRLAAADYLDHLRRDTTRIREVIARCDPAARVPGCPDWDADDLLWHHADVLWFWSENMRRRPQPPDEEMEADRPERPEEREAMLDAYSSAAAKLITTLDGLDPAEAAWSWADEQTVGFTYRRQALEALIHRLDAEQTAGEVTELDTALAADGVFELVEVMHGGELPDWGELHAGPHDVAIELTDTGDRMVVRPARFTGTEPTSQTVIDQLCLEPRPDGTPVHATVSGTAAHLVAWGWHRADDSQVQFAGDDDALAALREVLTRPME